MASLEQLDASFGADELWVIEKPIEDHGSAASAQPSLGQGQLVARRDDGAHSALVPMPLTHTDVSAAIHGCIAGVRVRQQFENPMDRPIEAIYDFPLQSHAMVNEFVMTVGDRRIRGIIRERREAEQIYHEARRQGYVVSLLAQARPHHFMQSVAHVEPGKRIDIDIHYFNTLEYGDGYFTFLFPMVVAPGTTETSAPTVRTLTTPAPERSGRNITLSVNLDAGVPVEHIESNHQVTMHRRGPGDVQVVLDPADTIRNRDFVLRYAPPFHGVKPALMVQDDGSGGGHVALMLVPPATLHDLPRSPLDLIFLIDASSRQRGLPLEESKAAVRYALAHLSPDDTFEVVRIGETVTLLHPTPSPADPSNINEALRWVSTIEGSGSNTSLAQGIRDALQFTTDRHRARYLAVLTDGHIDDEASVLTAIHRSLGSARLFSFAVGPHANRPLLNFMGRIGRGGVAYIGGNDNPMLLITDWLDQMSHPALSDLSIDWGAAEVQEILPRHAQDLYVGRPVMWTGRYVGKPPRSVAVRAKLADRELRLDVPAQGAFGPGTAAPDSKDLPAIWARMKMADLCEQSLFDQTIDLPRQVRPLAMRYNLVSAYTSFVAVDALTRTAEDHGVGIGNHGSASEGVRYDSTARPAQDR